MPEWVQAIQQQARLGNVGVWRQLSLGLGNCQGGILTRQIAGQLTFMLDNEERMR